MTGYRLNCLIGLNEMLSKTFVKVKKNNETKKNNSNTLKLYEFDEYCESNEDVIFNTNSS